jgi:hypothetical protein
MPGRALAASAHAVVFLCAMSARAEVPTHRVRVDYVAPRGCPGESELVAELQGRVPNMTLTRDDDALGLDVKVRRRAEGFEGRVIVHEPGGSPSQRVVRGETCEEVVAAVTLIAALTLDPAARVTPPTAAASHEATGGAQPSKPPLADVVPQIHEERAASHGSPPAAVDGAEAPPAQDAPSSLLLGAHAGASSRLTGTVLPSAALFVELGSTRRALVAPAVRARFERSATGTVTVIRGAGQFSWTLGSLELCPLAWSAWRLRVSPCARVDAGALAAVGRDVLPSRSDARLWLGAGGVVRTRYHIAGALYGELEETLFVPLLRDRFFVAPDVTVFRAAAAGWALSGGVGVSIW